jgi:peptidoglycan/LPS O-acetylase OafA/YrhL
MLSYTSIAPYFAIMLLCFILAHALSFLMPKSYWVHSKQQKHQVIEGIRSFLALGVFFHHAVITYYSYVTGDWLLPPSRFYANIGQFSVAVFFLITGFLFWEKAILAEGVISYKGLLTSRFRRIAPVYLVSALVVLIVILWQRDFAMDEPITKRLTSTLSLLFSMGVIPRSPINSVDPDDIYAGVLWTLKAEWNFYLALPILAYTLRKHIPKYIPIGLGVLFLFYVVGYRFNKSSILFLFMCGMLSATFYNDQRCRRFLDGSALLSVAGFMSLGAVLLLVERVYDYIGIALCFVFFMSILHLPANSFVRKLLQTPATKMLGSVSYSTYLIHGVVLHTTFMVFNNIFPVVSLDPLQMWLLVAVGATLVVLLSIISFRVIEFPFMRKPTEHIRAISK